MTTLLDSQFDPNKHVPVTVAKDDVVEEDPTTGHDRPDIPPPHAFTKGTYVTNMRTKQRAVIHRVDHLTRQMRLWYPDRKHLPNNEQFDGKTAWQSFDEWIPEITLSPAEVERQEAKKLFAEELEAFDVEGLQLVTVFCEDPDPVKALAKIRALKKTGLVRTKEAESTPAEPSTSKKGNK